MKKLLLSFLACGLLFYVQAQDESPWQGKFEQLSGELPSPNHYRTSDGSPGPEYWQQRADYDISVRLDDQEHKVTGQEKITYYNQSPQPLYYLWLQLDQNVRKDKNMGSLTGAGQLPDSLPTKFITSAARPFKGGFHIQSLKNAEGEEMPYVVNNTMMRVDLPEALQPGQQVELNLDWWYPLQDRMIYGGRSGYEYFPADDNYLYAIAQFYPRMAVYDDIEGWQNKQFMGTGEFALTFGNFRVKIDVPDDYIIAATGELQNEKDVLNKKQLKRLSKARKTYDEPVMIVTQKEAEANEKSRSKTRKTWEYYAENVRDFAFTASRKFIWDAMAVKIGEKTPLAMSLYPKEGNPLWERESTKAVRYTLETYSNYTIDYPYPVAISVHTANIGMEYPMICFNFGRPNADGTYSDGQKYNMISVIIHEVGHNFFPMIINSDERQWAWMDEGINSFLQYLVEQENYEDYPSSRGPATTITGYMGGNQKYIRPMMTSAEQLIQVGNNAYGKPAAALNILREVVMGRELFDSAFKTYARKWAFKHPKPADFFRTMEDASAVDLDWFWRGWFFTTDYVDIAIDDIKWIKLEAESNEELLAEGAKKEAEAEAAESDTARIRGPFPFKTKPTPAPYYGEFTNRVDETAVAGELEAKNLYQIKFVNKGGLVTPLLLRFTFDDGTTEDRKIPAEIWRYNESSISKLFAFDKVVVAVELDPEQMTADVNPGDNTFPNKETVNRFQKFKKNKEQIKP